MTVFVDTNVLIDLTKPDVATHDWSVGQVTEAKKLGPVYVSDIVYSEFSAGVNSVDDTDAAIESFAFGRCGYSHAVLFHAAKAFFEYRTTDNGERITADIPHYLIGALAQIDASPSQTIHPGHDAQTLPH